MKKILTALAAVLAVVGCASKEPTTPQTPSISTQKLAAPSDVKATQQGRAVIVSWTDNSEGETGFTVWMKKEGAALPVRLGGAGKDETSLTVSDNIVIGQTYNFGVCANSPIKESLNSDIIYSAPYIHQDLDPSVMVWTADPSSTYASVVFSYEAKDFEKTIVEQGICWSETAEPTIDGPHIAASAYRSGAQRQTVPSALLEDGKTYHFRAYASTADKTVYSTDATASLAAQPEAITFSWTDITPAGYPAEVKAYKTSSTLDGDPINAWYVIADISTGKVGLRASCPGGLKTLDDHWASDCLAMTNAGYFYGNNPVGLCIVNSAYKSTIESVRGTLRSTTSDYAIGVNEYDNMYPITRAAFGTDASGATRAVFNWKDQFYTAPLPQFVGDQKYEAPNKSWKEHRLTWTPKDAIGAGPMLVFDGKICPELSESERGTEYFINNNEVIPYDIYNVNESPDRTAIGHTADGKIVLFVCDGRIRSSAGATIVEVARIMKGLGCVDAVNMDGGGSTALHLTTGRVNSLEKNTSGGTENRPVPTVWSIYKK